MNVQLLILLICAVHFGLSISFSIQRWNALTWSGRPTFDATLREQFGDSVLVALIALAVVLIEPVRYPAAACVGLGLLTGVLMLRLIRRLRAAGHSASSR